jgi:hypothetical protein
MYSKLAYQPGPFRRLHEAEDWQTAPRIGGSRSRLAEEKVRRHPPAIAEDNTEPITRGKLFGN